MNKEINTLLENILSISDKQAVKEFAKNYDSDNYIAFCEISDKIRDFQSKNKKKSFKIKPFYCYCTVFCKYQIFRDISYCRENCQYYINKYE